MRQVPVILITGFLGSGKTTLINWILEKNPEIKVSVILNEFGNIKLESQFVKSHSGETIELANGCMCCVAKSDIPRVIELILDQSKETEYILIEASGLSDPDPIKESLADERLRSIVALYRTICVIDVQNFLATYRDHPLILSQAADADSILLSKIQSSPEKLTEVRGIIANNLTHTPIQLWTGDLTFESLMSAKLPNAEQNAHHHIHEAMEHTTQTMSEGLSRAQIEALFSPPPAGVYRAKGSSVAGATTYLIQYVAGELEIQERERGRDEANGTTILYFREPAL